MRRSVMTEAASIDVGRECIWGNVGQGYGGVGWSDGERCVCKAIRVESIKS